MGEKIVLIDPIISENIAIIMQEIEQVRAILQRNDKYRRTGC